MATHAMIDIETLGTKPNAVILSVGGVKFDPFTNNPPFKSVWMVEIRLTFFDVVFSSTF